MMPTPANVIRYGYQSFEGWYDIFLFVLPQGDLVRDEIRRQVPSFYPFHSHLGAWPISPNTEKQIASVSLDDFVGKARMYDD